MRKIVNKSSLLTLLFLITPLLLLAVVNHLGLLSQFIQWSKNNLVLFIPILFLLKVIGIVYPPMPGGIYTLGSIPILGWGMAFFIDALGNIVGSTIAYYLGDKYGELFLKRIFGENIINKLRQIKIKKGKEFESIFVIRLLGANIVEMISYGSGFLKVNFNNFFFATLLSHAAVGIPVYYFAKSILSSANIFVSVIFGIFFFVVIWKLKGRYFE